MRDEKEQDREIGHATLVKIATDDGKHKSRNSSWTTRINNNKHKDASIIRDSITNHVTGSITSTNKENQQARQSRQKPTRHQLTHATYGTSTDIIRICLIQEYESGTEILIAAVTQENTSDDNANGKKQESGEVCLEETGNHTKWDKQREGCVKKTKKRRHGKENQKSTRKQLSTYFQYRRKAPLHLLSDKDSHLDICTIIIAI
jgi:hypothetical protein